MKKLLKTLLCVVLAIVLLAAGLVAWLSIAEYRPAAQEEVPVLGQRSGAPAPGDNLNVLSWNIGYCGLGEDADFFMDGGSSVRGSEEDVLRYMDGIRQTVDDIAPDVAMLQEVDIDSHRTYGWSEAESLTLGSYAHALNYSCPFVPYPLPPIGKVHSGLMTTTGELHIDSAERVALPCPFSWPVSTANLKRCLLVSRVPMEGTDAELVLVNLHLEAYDDGEGKKAQTEQLKSFIRSEYEKGNYVIAGGDFNQVFPGSLEKYPITTPELWEPGVLEADMLPEGWSFAYDTKVPSCRLLNQPYDPADTEHTQHYVIDGFIISPNVELKGVETLDLGFENSDHNPVSLAVTLK